MFSALWVSGQAHSVEYDEDRSVVRMSHGLKKFSRGLGNLVPDRADRAALHKSGTRIRDGASSGFQSCHNWRRMEQVEAEAIPREFSLWSVSGIDASRCDRHGSVSALSRPWSKEARR